MVMVVVVEDEDEVLVHTYGGHVRCRRGEVQGQRQSLEGLHAHYAIRGNVVARLRFAVSRVTTLDVRIAFASCRQIPARKPPPFVRWCRSDRHTTNTEKKKTNTQGRDGRL